MILLTRAGEIEKNKSWGTFKKHLVSKQRDSVMCTQSKNKQLHSTSLFCFIIYSCDISILCLISHVVFNYCSVKSTDYLESFFV